MAKQPKGTCALCGYEGTKLHLANIFQLAP